MTDIMLVFACLNQELHPTTLRQLMLVAQAMLSMTGRVTMRRLSRWASKGKLSDDPTLFQHHRQLEFPAMAAHSNPSVGTR